MAEYWEVIYKAVADFGELMAEAAAAKKALQDLGKAAKAEAATETAGAKAAADARKADSAAIKQQIADLATLAAAAKSANEQTVFGGRSTMDQHLADMSREVQYSDLLNRAHWLNFTSPQQAFSWNQQVLQQRRLMNYAEWGGYTTPDQYLNYLQRERGELTNLNAIMMGRAGAYRTMTSAALDYTNALQGTHKTLGELGGSSAALSALQQAITGIPGQVTTKFTVDDSQGIAALATYRAMLSGIPRAVATSQVVAAGEAMGAVPLGGPARIGGDSGAQQFAARLAQLMSVRDGAEVAADAAQTAQMTQFWAALRSRWANAQSGDHNPVLLPGGTGGTGGGGPPPVAAAAAPEPSPQDNAAWDALGNKIHNVGQETVTTYLDISSAITRISDAWHTVFTVSEDGVAQLQVISDQVLRMLGSGLLPAIEQGKKRLELMAADEHAVVSDLPHYFQAGARGTTLTFGPQPTGDPYRERYFSSGPGGTEKVRGIMPNPQDKAAWDALGSAINNDTEDVKKLGDTIQGSVVYTIADAIANMQKLAAEGKLAGGQLGYILQTLQKMSQDKINNLGLTGVQSFINLIAQTNDAGKAAKDAYNAYNLYKVGVAQAGDQSGMTTAELLKLSAGFFTARKSADAAAAAVAAATGGFGGLGNKFVLWGGLLGGNALVGAVSGWHFLIAGILDFLAVGVPALGALVIGLGAFAAAAYFAGNTVTALKNNIVAMHTVSNATGQALGPFTGALQALQSKIQPQVWQLAGDGMILMGKGTGVFATIAEKTGAVVDNLAAKITNWLMGRSGKGLLDFFAIGGRDLSMFAHALAPLGGIFMDFVRASMQTQVSEHLLALLGITIGAVAKALSYIPTWALAAGIGLHAFSNYGGIAATWIQQLVLGVDRMIARIPGMQGFALSFGRALNASSTQLESIAASSPRLQGLSKQLGITAMQAAQMEQYLTANGKTIESTLPATGRAADLFAQYGTNLKGAGREAVAAGIAFGGSDEQVKAIAKDAESAATKSSGFGKVMGGVGSFLSSNWILIAAAVAAGFGYIANQALSATAGTQKFVTGLQQGLSQMSAGQAFVAIPSILGQIRQQIAQTNKAWASSPGFLGAGGALNSWSAAWERWRHNFSTGWHALFGGNANPDLGPLQNQLNSTLKTYGAMTQVITGLTKQGYNFAQSLGIMNAAGVTVNDNFDVMNTKVTGLIKGYQLAGQQSGTLGSDMNVLNVAASDSLSSMQKLNQAWDTWTGIVAAPVNSFLTLNQSLTQFATDAKNAGANMSGLGTIISATQTTGNTSANQLQQDFQTIFSNVQQMFDSVRNAQAVGAGQGGTGDMFTQMVKASVAALIPLAGTNKAAAAEISALAQEAGGPASTNLQQLAKWAGNVKNPMQALQQITQQAAVSASNLSQDASLLTTSIQQELIPQMAASIIAASKAGPAMNSFATAVFSGKKNISDLGQPAQTLYNTLLKVAGNADNARALFIGFAEAMGLGKDKATALADYVQGHPIKPKVDPASAEATLHHLGSTVVNPQVKPKLDTASAENTLHHLGKTVTDALQPPAKQGWWEYWWGQSWKGFWVNLGVPVNRFFTKDLVNWNNNSNAALVSGWQTVNKWWNTNFVLPMDNFFLHDLPNWYNNSNQALIAGYQWVMRWWGNNVSGPWDQFWNHTIEGWFSKAGQWFQNTWQSSMSWFQNSVELPIGDLFSKKIPGWFSNVGRFFSNAWAGSMTWFQNNVELPIGSFFNKTLPGWIGSLGNIFNNAWNTAWGDFNKDIWQPVQGFFTKTVPGWLGFASGGDPGAAFNGSVPGSSEADNYRAVVMGGEYVLRQPARMALESDYGRGFMDWLNQYDTLSGSGSRGVLASQRPSGGGRYAGGGGLLGDFTSFISGAASKASHFTGSALKALQNLLGKGAETVFNGMWDVSIGPILNGLPRDIPGDVAHWLGNEAKAGVDKKLGQLDQKTSVGRANLAQYGTSANPFGSAGGPGGGAPAANAALARSMMPAWGSGAEWAAWNDLEMHEAGWNQFARNPGSGAYGIPQALPPTKMPFAAQAAGGSNPRAQIDWMIQYIQYLSGPPPYGDPINADYHEHAYNWYASGGPVISAIKSVTSDDIVREAMGMGSWLQSRWNDKASAARGTAVGPYLLELRRHRGLSKTQADDPMWSTRFMLPHYLQAAQVNRSIGNMDSESVVEAIAREAQARGGTQPESWSKGAANEAWQLTREALGIIKPPVHHKPKPKPPVPVTTRFFEWMNKIAGTVNLASSDWDNLRTRPEPFNPHWLLQQAAKLKKEAHKARTRAERHKLLGEAARDTHTAQGEAQQWNQWEQGVRRSNAAGLNTFTAWRALANQLDNPAMMNHAEWDNMWWSAQKWGSVVFGSNGPDRDDRSSGGGGHGKIVNQFGPDTDSDLLPYAQFGQKHFPVARKHFLTDIDKLKAEVPRAYNVWRGYWGERVAKYGSTPGIVVRNPGDTNKPVDVNPYQFITGGPSGGGDTGPYGYGFRAAAGGAVPDITAMFAAGGALPAPNFVLPGASATMQRQMAGAASQSLPRTLADAAGDTIGLQVGTMNINNPAAERPSDSIARASNRLAFLAGRGAY